MLLKFRLFFNAYFRYTAFGQEIVFLVGYLLYSSGLHWLLFGKFLNTIVEDFNAEGQLVYC